MIRIFNSLTGRKEALEPLQPGHVRLYVCGMTVYDYCHIGHARVMVVFDMVVRYLRARGYRVTYVRNITDVDDKIIKRAAENNESIDALTARFIQAMNEDAAALGVLPPDQQPRATQHIGDIVKMIATLVDKEFAYRAPNGDVYYAVNRFASYGALSRENLEDQRAGARVEIDANKRDPLDFVLWKAAKPGEVSWPSPWGLGRPGWHIECSAMATCSLGNHFDIHGGGMDLKFPHHENEIAQSEAATGEKFVNIWMHNGFVQIDDEKMSKSLGNFFTVREVLQTYKPEDLRFFILNSHYRGPLNYSDAHLDQAHAACARVYTAMRDIPRDDSFKLSWDDVDAQRFAAAMDDDFNTPAALAVVFDMARDLNRAKDQRDAAGQTRLASLLRALGGVLGLFQNVDDDASQGMIVKNVNASTGTLSFKGEVAQHAGLETEFLALIAKREEARAAKNWAEADRLRKELKERGILIEDGTQGTRWRRV